MREITIVTNNTELQAGQEIGPDLFNRFVAWVDRSPRTTKTYTTNLHQFFAWMLYAGVRQPQRQDIINYRDWLQSEHDAIALNAGSTAGWRYRTDNNGNKITLKCSPSTVKGYMQSVRAFFAWTSSEQLYPNVASNVHLPKVDASTHRKEALQTGEVLEVEQAISTAAAEKAEAAAAAAKDAAGRMQRADEQGKRMKAIYLLCVNCGLRTVEISRANVRDFTTRNGESWLYVYGKGHTEADTKKALAPEVAAAVTDYLNSRTDSYTGSSPLFVATGNRSGGKRVAPQTISTWLKQAMKDAGIDDPRITAHSLRHTAGTSVMEINGGNIYETQSYMRHQSPTTTEIYLHRNMEKSDADTAARLYSFYHGGADGDSLEDMIKTLSTQQRKQLETIVKAMKEAG